MLDTFKFSVFKLLANNDTRQKGGKVSSSQPNFLKIQL